MSTPTRSQPSPSTMAGPVVPNGWHTTPATTPAATRDTTAHDGNRPPSRSPLPASERHDAGPVDRAATLASNRRYDSADSTESTNGTDGDSSDRRGEVAVPGWARALTTLAVIVVALVAAVVSYEHMREVAALAGEGWRAWLLPLSVDGLIVAASMTMLVRRRRGQPAGWLAWSSLLLGIAASIAANVASADPGWIPRLVAAWSPLALLLAVELLMQQGRPPRHPRHHPSRRHPDHDVPRSVAPQTAHYRHPPHGADHPEEADP